MTPASLFNPDATYTGAEVSQIAQVEMNRQIANVLRAVYSGIAAAEDFRDKVWRAEQRRHDLSRITVRIFTKVDCLTGEALAEKLEGEIGAFMDTFNQMIEAVRQYDPAQAETINRDMAPVAQALIDGIKTVLSGSDPQAEAIRTVMEEMDASDNDYMFSSIDTHLGASGMTAVNLYIGEQGLRLKELGLRGKSKVARMRDDLRKLEKPAPVQQEALRVLENVADPEKFIRLQEERLMRVRKG